MDNVIFSSDLYSIESHDGAYSIYRKIDNESVLIPYGIESNAFAWDYDGCGFLASKVNNLCEFYFNLYY